MEFKIISKKYGEFKVLIDDEDWAWVSLYKWNISLNKTYPYVKRRFIDNNKITTISLHKIITQCPEGFMVDHINHNTLDNRKCNLRICSITENTRNSRKPKSGKTSVYKGVYLDKRCNLYVSTIIVDRKKISLGYFKDEKDAAKVYNDAAILYHKDFACLNIV